MWFRKVHFLWAHSRLAVGNTNSRAVTRVSGRDVREKCSQPAGRNPIQGGVGFRKLRAKKSQWEEVVEGDVVHPVDVALLSLIELKIEAISGAGLNANGSDNISEEDVLLRETGITPESKTIMSATLATSSE